MYHLLLSQKNDRSKRPCGQMMDQISASFLQMTHYNTLKFLVGLQIKLTKDRLTAEKTF